MAYNSYSGDKRGGYGNGNFQREDKTVVPDPVEVKTFYVQGSKDVRPDLFNEFAEKVAKTFAEVKEKDGKEIRNGITSTQLRRLFDEVKRYERLLVDGKEESWTAQYPYIKMIKAKVHYTVARCKKNDKHNAGYYDNLSVFISGGIDLIKSVRDYHVFVSLFEAVYGFYYENRPDVKN